MVGARSSVNASAGSCLPTAVTGPQTGQLKLALPASGSGARRRLSRRARRRRADQASRMWRFSSRYEYRLQLHLTPSSMCAGDVLGHLEARQPGPDRPPEVCTLNGSTEPPTLGRGRGAAFSQPRQFALSGALRVECKPAGLRGEPIE